MTINPKTTLTESVGTNVTRTTGGTHTHKITGEYAIHYVARADVRYDGEYRKHVGGDTHVFESDDDNYTNTVTRGTGSTATTSTSVKSL